MLMLDKILDFAEKYNMFPEGASVVCGLSGGADSVSLLGSLCLLRKRLKLNSVEALHVNHCIRGEESDRDEDFCRELCKKLDVQLTVVTCNVPLYAEKHSLSLEEAARKLRYNAFSQYSNGKIIATAHNANDNLETAVLNLARGSALKGMSGIPPVRDNIVRPLLSVTRNEIEEFLNINHLEYVTDSTNLSDDYTRNRIRHKIAPALSEINPSVINTFIRSAEVLREENAFIDAEVDKALSECRDGNKFTGLNKYPSLIKRRCIAAVLSENNMSYGYDILYRCENIVQNGGKLNICGNVFFVSDGNISELKKIEPANHEQIAKKLVIGKNIIFPGKCVNAELISDTSYSEFILTKPENGAYLLDYDKLCGSLIIRNRKFGDKIRLKGRDFTSSIKKIINEKIPSGLRNELHFLEDSKGTVMAEMIGVAERASPTEATVNILKITISAD